MRGEGRRKKEEGKRKKSGETGEGRREKKPDPILLFFVPSCDLNGLRFRIKADGCL